MPPTVEERTNYTLRNRSNISFPQCRTIIFQRSCIPSSIAVWNNQDCSLRQTISFSSFKTSLELRYTHSSNELYLTGDRHSSVLHARLRNNCSNLNNDLFHNHLNNTPFCSCGNFIEDAEHYLFVCPKFVEERIIMFHETRTFHPLNVDKLLYGMDNISIADNSKLFKSVQTFIKSSKRFA